jgi:hypothetical protein
MHEVSEYRLFRLILNPESVGRRNQEMIRKILAHNLFVISIYVNGQ